jgi:hypothetical protein
MEHADVVLASVVVGLVAQTGALFYWGGSVRQMLRDHERRLNQLDRRVHHQIALLKEREDDHHT